MHDDLGQAKANNHADQTSEKAEAISGVDTQPRGNIEKPQFGEMVVACVVCRERRPVLLYPHRLDSKVVGWVFVCAADQHEIQGSEVLIRVIRPSVPAQIANSLT